MMLHLSPSNLVAYEQLGRPDSPWMTKEKFKAQFLGLDSFSEKADAGNAVHDAALGGMQLPCWKLGCNAQSWAMGHGMTKCAVCDSSGVVVKCATCEGTGKVRVSEWPEEQATCAECVDGFHAPDWLVAPDLIEAIRSHLRATDGEPEAAFVLPFSDFGITLFDGRLSMRFDYLTTRPRVLHELKTTGELHIERYARSAQVLAYLVALRIPVVLIGAEIKIKKLGRMGRKGDVVLVRHEERVCEPKADDADRLKDLVLRAARYIMDDKEMTERALNRTDPELL